jgi:hypothetical protein
MKKVLLLLFVSLLSASLFGQYGGTPWLGTPWQFGSDNIDNLSNGRVLAYKYDVGPAMSPGGEGSIEPSGNLEWVAGMRTTQWQTRLIDGAPAVGWDTRKSQAFDLEIELHPTDIALIDGWSNFQWDMTHQRMRDGGSWYRYTVEFEEGIYRFVNRGFANANGNFNMRMTLRNPETMELVWTSDWWNNLKDAGGRVIQLGNDPSTFEAPYNLLGEFITTEQNWWVLTDPLELSGKYVMEIEENRSGALGGQYSEFSFESVPADIPTITDISASPAQIDGCDGETTITVTATPHNAGEEIHYRFILNNYVLQDWSSVNTLTTYWSGDYVVQAKEAKLVLWDTDTLTVEKINCAPTPYMGTAQTLPGAVEFEYFDAGGHGIAYWEMSSPFVNANGWDVRNTEENGFMGMDIDEYPADSDTVTVREWGNNSLKDSEWAIYTIDVAETGDYAVALQYYVNVNVGRNMQIEFWDENMTSAHDSLSNLRIFGNWEVWDQDSVDITYRPIPAAIVDRYIDTTYTDIISLKAGTYKMKFYANAFNMLLDKLRFDKLADIPVELYVENSTRQQTVPFRIAANKNAMVYVVPEGTAPTADLPSLAVASRSVMANDTVNFATSEIDLGNYVMYAVDKIDNVSTGINVTVEELIIPVVSVAQAAVFPGFPFVITMDQDGNVYLVNDTVTAEHNIPSLAGAFSAVANANTPVNLSTIGLDLGFYKIYGINSDGTVSEGVRVEVSTDVSADQPVYQPIRVYPTVVKEILMIELPSTANVDVYNMLGERVKSIRSVESGQIELSDLTRGMYILKIGTHEVTQSYRIIKQ